ncbi:MAG TPA: hypothetical protein VMT69_00590 [Kineosporiaceae bacterium]|nr:hypothetical protein [Kineosporiaceae bacterium]
MGTLIGMQTEGPAGSMDGGRHRRKGPRTRGGTRFSERTRLPVPFLLVLATVAVAEAVVLMVGARSSPPPAPAGVLALGLLVGIALPLALMAVHTVVVVRGEELQLSLPPFWRRRIRLDGIASVEVRDVSPLRDAGGYGLRFRGHGRVALVMRRGPAVEVRTVTGETYLVGTVRPQLLLAALDS